jgi:hypothetical protein
VQALLAHLESIARREDEVAGTDAAASGAPSKEAAAGSSQGSKFAGFSDGSLDQFMVLLAQLGTTGPASMRSEAADGLVQLALLRGRCGACVRASCVQIVHPNGSSACLQARVRGRARMVHTRWSCCMHHCARHPSMSVSACGSNDDSVGASAFPSIHIYTYSIRSRQYRHG